MKNFIKNRKNQQIVAIVDVPENPKSLAFVMHGLGGFKEQPHLMLLVEILISHGYAVVNFDSTNSFGESDGNYEKATFQGYYEDLVDVIAWAKTQDWYKEPFLLAGHSLGAYCVARYSEEYPQKIKAVFPYAVAVAGELTYTKKLTKEDLKNWEDSGWREEENKDKPGIIKRLPWSYMEERLKHDLRPNTLKLTMPVLLVVGENDTSCAPETQEIFYDLIPGPKEIHIIPGAPHTFKDSEHLAQLKNIFEKWLEKINEKPD